jgi:hypothetical protein
MASRFLPWMLAGGTAVLTYLAVRTPRGGADDHGDPELDHTSEHANAPELRNAALIYRPLGEVGERYPDWVRALKGRSGVYVIRVKQSNGSSPVVYVGESHTDRLYQTLTRHFQRWHRSKKFWSHQYGGQGHDPGLTYRRERATVAVRVLPPSRAMDEETRLIAKLRPRDNLLKQPTDELEEVVPF